MDPEEYFGTEFSDHVNLEGTNVGASSRVHHYVSGKSESCCSINIYVTSNVQGVNNSIVVGSEVLSGDPGVFLCMGDLYMKGGPLKKKKKKKKNWRSFNVFLMMCIVGFLLLSAFSVFVQQ